MTDAHPISYPAEAILTTEQVAEWLQVSPELVDTMRLPRLAVTGRRVRYSAGMVLAFLEGRLDTYLARAVA